MAHWLHHLVAIFIITCSAITVCANFTRPVVRVRCLGPLSGSVVRVRCPCPLSGSVVRGCVCLSLCQRSVLLLVILLSGGGASLRRATRRDRRQMEG